MVTIWITVEELQSTKRITFTLRDIPYQNRFYGKKGHQNTFGGNRDAYLAKISQCIANPGTDVQTACDSYKWIDGKTYTASTNTPQFTLTSTDGCDSVVTLNLTINISPKRTYTVSALWFIYRCWWKNVHPEWNLQLFQSKCVGM